MTTKKQAKVLSMSNEDKARRHYKIPPTHQLNEDELLDWLAQIAHDGKHDWGWIRAELNRRLAQAKKQLLKQQKGYDDLWNTNYKDMENLNAELAQVRTLHAEKAGQYARSLAELEQTIATLRERLADETRKVADLEASMDLRTDADSRAIRMWQEATGNDHVWPDAAKLTVWLMERLFAMEAEARKQEMRMIELQEDNARAHAELLKD